MFTLYDLRELFIDDNQLVRIYDSNADQIYMGCFDELPDDMENCEITSIDNVYQIDFDGYIGINIDA